MTWVAPATAREAPKRTYIVNELKRRIVEGEVHLGQQLPPRVDLVRDFDASSKTLQEALDVLMEEGFVISQGNKGTFVAERPPHLSRYGFVFAPDPGGMWLAFTNAIQRAVGGVEQERSCRFVFYQDITRHTDTLGYQQLLQDIEARRLAGLIFRGNVRLLDLDKTPFVTTPGLPRVAVSGLPAVPGVTYVVADGAMLCDKVLDRFASRGRRRIAFLSDFALSTERMHYLANGVEKRGMTMRPTWVHVLPRDAVRRVVGLLMSLPPGERPDGLLVGDENMMNEVSAGLLESGVDVKRDIDTVAYSYMPSSLKSLVPVTRIGEDVRELLRAFVDVIDRTARTHTVQKDVVVKPLFEEELTVPVEAM